MNEPDQLATEARYLAYALRERLQAEGFEQLVPGIEAILGELDAAPEEISFEEALDNAASLYRSMAAGPGSLGDVVLWRDDDQAETARINEEYEHLRLRLYGILIDRRRGPETAPGT